MRCTAFRRPSARCVYTCVVEMSAWPSIICTLRRSAPCSTMCVAQLWRNPCGLVDWFDLFTMLQIHCRVSGMPRKRQEEPRAVLPRCSVSAGRADSFQVWAALAQILFECLNCRAAQRHDAFLVAFAANLHAAGIEAEIADAERRDLGDAQAARIEKLENGVVAQRCGFGLWMRGRHVRALQHFCHFGLGKRFGQNLPGFRRLDVDGWVVMDAAIEKEPFVKAAQTAQLARRGAGVDVVVAQVIEKRGDIGLGCFKEHGVALLEQLGKDAQVAEIGLASERAKSFFHTKIGCVVF